MSMILIDRLTEDRGYPVLDENTFDDFVDNSHECVLFLTENPKHYPESNDVAIILPELMSLFGNRLKPAIVSRDMEKDIARRYGVRQWPTLVFLRDGQYLGAIARVRNWDEYLMKVRDLLEGEARRPPSIGIPVVTA